jgi:hypothetical protein
MDVCIMMHRLNKTTPRNKMMKNKYWSMMMKYNKKKAWNK